MKRLFTLLIALFLIVSAKSQLVVDTTANWQQLIPTILGGNCVNISNVTYNAGNGTSAVYSNFPGFGDGILITTGQALNAQGINDNGSIGNDNGLGGNSQLNQYLPQGTFTYDATWLTFNFQASYSGTVSVDYIFASEEYPEFVNSGFNDIFGFFVQATGVPSQNIALIPGTQIPVSIDNVNQFTNTSFFVDNTNGTGLQYDGYTVPLTASFQADSGVVYTLTIAIGDVGDGIFDSGVFLKTYASSTQSMTGNVTHLGQPAQGGFAELLGYNTDSTAAPLIDVQPIVNGSYTFPNVTSGAYNVRITLDTILHPNTYPTYFDSVYMWNDATIISAPCANYDLDMQLLVLNNGLGDITGTIGNSGEIYKVSKDGAPLVNGHVFLVGADDNLVYGFDLTNDNGQFHFAGVPDGTYNIMVDVPGLLMDAIRTITVSPSNRIFTNQSYIVGANKIIISDTPLPVVENPIVTGLKIQPNPTEGPFSTTFTLKNNAYVTLDVYNSMGQKVVSVFSGNLNAGFQQINGSLAGLSDGIYYLRLVTNSADTIVRKITKTEVY
jgi:hypothetical protein